MQLRRAHLLDGWLPELVLYQQLDSQILVLDLTEGVLRQLAVTCITEYLTYGGVGHWRVLHLHDLSDLWPVLRLGVCADGDCEIDLLVQVQGTFETLGLLIVLLRILRDEVVDQLAQGLINKLSFGVRFLVVLYLFVIDLVDLADELDIKLVLVGGIERPGCLLERTASDLDVGGLVGCFQALSDLCVVLTEGLEAEVGLHFLRHAVLVLVYLPE